MTVPAQAHHIVDTLERVQRTLEFFQRKALWHVVSRNSRATSCRDAASRRVRLGTTGIPLYDELKSLCVVLYRGGERRFALLHCRATGRFDLDAAAQVLAASRPLARLSSEELAMEFATSYGTVNPFSEAARFIQVFDEDVLSHYTPPFSMMTNAGEHTWAVEFQPAELIDALRSETEVHVACITRQRERRKELPSFGIITGNGPESGMALWQQINEIVHSRLSADGRMYGDLAYPRVLIHSLPEMGLSMELVARERQVWGVLSAAVDQLCAAGVRYIALACNTTPYYGDRIQERARQHGAEFISMPDVVLQHLRERPVEDLTIIGIPVVAELGEYSAYRALRELNVRPMNDKARAHLQELGYMVKKLGLGMKDSRALNKLLHGLTTGVDTRNVLVALTEISVLLQRFPKFSEEINGRRVIDALRLYSERLAALYLEALPHPDGGNSEEDSWE